MFLAMNHQPIDYNEKALEQLTLTVAEGKAKKKEIASALLKGIG